MGYSPCPGLHECALASNSIRRAVDASDPRRAGCRYAAIPGNINPGRGVGHGQVSANVRARDRGSPARRRPARKAFYHSEEVRRALRKCRGLEGGLVFETPLSGIPRSFKFGGTGKHGKNGESRRPDPLYRLPSTTRAENCKKKSSTFTASSSNPCPSTGVSRWPSRLGWINHLRAMASRVRALRACSANG
jgi:hypothetical protein